MRAPPVNGGFGFVVRSRGGLAIEETMLARRGSTMDFC
jgi:hypothetical protein